MASTFKYPTNAKKPGDLNGRGVVFNRPTDRKRVRLKLGRVTNAVAGDVCRRIDSLSRCAKLHTEPSGNVVEWLAGVSNGLHRKLALHGLTDPRVAPVEVPTLGEWCSRYADERRGDLKPATVVDLRCTCGQLTGYFGETTLIDKITVSGGRDWRAWLRSRPVGKPKPPENDPEGKPVQRRMSDGTARKHTRNAKSIFAAAAKRGLIPSSPFDGLPSGSVAADRQYIAVDDAEAIIGELPVVQWRALWGLARFAGLRCDSETHRLTWGDVDFDKGRLRVHCTKTERYAGHRDREVPMTPRLRELLLDVFTAAPEGSERVLTVGGVKSHRHTVLRAAISRAGLSAIPRVFQNARVSAETDWAANFPQHAVSKWVGHSVRVSVEHYLCVTDDLFDAAAGLDSEAPPKGYKKGTECSGTGENERETVASDRGVSPTGNATKQVVSGGKTYRGRRESNPQPPDRQSGTLTN